jgi:voltage-gated potassium channel
MYGAEHNAQPEVFRNAFSGIWWSMSTLLTIGYGDIYPITVVGRLMAIVISFLGVGVVAIPTGIISAGFVEQYHRKSVISDWKRDDVKEISEILVDARLAGQLVEDVEDEETTKVYLIVRDNLSILPRRDIQLKLGDVLIMRMDTH